MSRPDTDQCRSEIWEKDKKTKIALNDELAVFMVDPLEAAPKGYEEVAGKIEGAHVVDTVSGEHYVLRPRQPSPWMRKLLEQPTRSATICTFGHKTSPRARRHGADEGLAPSPS